MNRRRVVTATAAVAVAALVIVEANHIKVPPVDFDGDLTSDLTVVRNVGGGPTGQVRWFALGAGGVSYFDWGIASDLVVPADYDGDGHTDVAVWRPGPAGTAAFYILQSANRALRVVPFGQTGDDPTVVADYDGDGRADPAVYRAGATPGSQSFWFYFGSLDNPGGNISYIPWGLNGDSPAPGDYDGDGRNDVAVRRDGGSGQAVFYLLQTTVGFSVIPYGRPSDTFVPGDYTGDGRSDLTVTRDNGGQLVWYIRDSATGFVSQGPFGASATDLPAPGDYDGDGRIDMAVWRMTTGQFWARRSSNGLVLLAPWGSSGDYPAANFNVH